MLKGVSKRRFGCSSEQARGFFLFCFSQYERIKAIFFSFAMFKEFLCRLFAQPLVFSKCHVSTCHESGNVWSVVSTALTIAQAKC